MILTDTGYWVALGNKKDRWHQHTIDVSQTIQDELVITWPVITETCHLLGMRLGSHAQQKFLEQVKQVTQLFNLKRDHLERCQILMIKYAKLPMDLADASLVIAAEELDSGKILSTDQRDFNAYRWKNYQPFENLLLP